MIKNYDYAIEIYYNPNWLIESYWILIITGFGSSETNVLLNLIKNQQPDIGKVSLYFKDPFKSKYWLLNNGRRKVGIKNLKNPKAFIGYSQTIDDVYEIWKTIIQRRKGEC